MSLLLWKDEYSVGVKELDAQHQKMFVLINQFYELMRDKTDKENMEAVLKELTDYASYHLATEEKLFAEHGYPNSEAHIKQHDEYREKINDFMRRKDETLLSFDIIDYLEDWWLGHVTGADQGYVGFFKEKGLS